MSMTATAQWAALPDHSAEIARVREEFITAYGYEPDGVWSAPGRLNLLGEYIDFLGGSCLPMPLPYRTYVAGALRRDGVLRAGTGPLGGAVLGGISGALMGAGMSVIEQKVKGERVDWSKAGKEALKGAITGAVTGLVTGGLGNLKNLADGVTKVSKLNALATKFPKAVEMQQAASAMVSKIPTAISRASAAVASRASAAASRVSAAAASRVSVAISRASTTASKVSAAATNATASVKSALTPHATKFGGMLNKDKILKM